METFKKNVSESKNLTYSLQDSIQQIKILSIALSFVSIPYSFF